MFNRFNFERLNIGEYFKWANFYGKRPHLYLAEISSYASLELLNCDYRPKYTVMKRSGYLDFLKLPLDIVGCKPEKCCNFFSTSSKLL